MKFDWKNALITIVTAWIGIIIINKFFVPLLPDSLKKLVS